MVDRRRARALFRQIADELTEEITSGRRRPGEAMPSADLICRTYGVGMATAKKALGILSAAGLIETESGRVARVRVQPERQIIKVQRGSSWWTREATPEDREKLTLRDGERVIVLVHGARVTLYPADSTEFHTS